jgi:hypothetical protein
LPSTVQTVPDSANPATNDTSEQWDDEALAAATTRKVAVPTSATAELLEMKNLDLKRSEQGDIAEKLRVEETKAQLAAAKAGMEKEAQRLKEEKEMKKQGGFQEVVTNNKPRFGAAAAGMAGGSKWLPPHMRAGGSGLSMPSRFAGASQKVDTQDENLFPDLAAASAILEQQKQQPAYKAPKKTPVGGGATWGNRPKLNLASKKVETEKPAVPEPKPEAKPEETKPAESEPADKATAEPAKAAEPVAAPAAAPIKPKKKKKKDLSTFKAAS